MNDNTAPKYMTYLQTLGDVTVALPIIWTKDSAEELSERKLTNAEWNLIAERFLTKSEDLYDASIDSMTDAIETVVGRL